MGNVSDCTVPVPGYRNEWELVFRDQTKQTVERHKVKAAKPVGGVLLAPNRMGTSVEEMGVNYFLRHFINGGESAFARMSELHPDQLFSSCRESFTS